MGIIDRLFTGGRGSGSDPGLIMGPDHPDNQDYWKLHLEDDDGESEV